MTRRIVTKKKYFQSEDVTIYNGDSRNIWWIRDESVDLIVTSPPYYKLRSYKDGGVVYKNQIGSERTMSEYIENLTIVTRELVRVLKPNGSIFINLGDKYDSNKSLMGIPWTYALSCVKGLGLILRSEIIWSKPNVLPESVNDRVKRAHEQWFHFVKTPYYFSSIDLIREEYSSSTLSRNRYKRPVDGHPSSNHNGPLRSDRGVMNVNPLGKLPGSVWSIATESLRMPKDIDIKHAASFPTEWPRRFILGWSPESSLILDPFCGTGTTGLVASMLQRKVILIDKSRDYCELAKWRTSDPEVKTKLASKWSKR